MFDIRGLFTKEAIIRTLLALPALRTPVMDTIFLDRPQSPLPLIGTHDIMPVTNALPVVRRGAPSIQAVAESGAIGWYEPLPVKPNCMVTGKDLNDLKLLDAIGREAWVSAKTDLLRRACRQTTEALCAVALGGSIAWPVRLEGGGWESWEIAFGSTLAVPAPGLLLDAASAKVRDVFELLSAMHEAIQERGYGGEVVVWAGKDVYSALFAIAEKTTSTAKLTVEITDQGINIGGFLVKRRAEKYRDPRTGAMIPVLADKKIRMIATDAGHRLVYAAVDDLDANLQPLPFFVKPIKIDDPSGYKLIAESKPFPVPNVNGICDAVAVA